MILEIIGYLYLVLYLTMIWDDYGLDKEMIESTNLTFNGFMLTHTLFFGGAVYISYQMFYNYFFWWAVVWAIVTMTFPYQLERIERFWRPTNRNHKQLEVSAVTLIFLGIATYDTARLLWM